MKLTVLGCGDAFASEGRYTTSFLVSDEQTNLLVDCGASTLIRLKQLNISPEAIDVIVITHFHGDHYGGIPFLIISNKVQHDRKRPMKIVGPKGVREKVYQLQEALYPGTSTMLDELPITIEEYGEDFVQIAESIEVRGLSVTHSPPSNPHGVQVKWNDKLFGFSGDTEWDDHLIDLATGTDLFIVECNNLWQDSPGHLSYRTIMDRRDDFLTGRLLLTHMGSEVINEPDLGIERLQDGMVLDF
ncbi:MBL fold metallo-hydrolase [Marinoscillum sp.]|uniref:MBL fold metallo-hydrolase n=1 Tax=Marinoscillum sp. TaxID=2024838 RepID=UPI003BAB4D9C